MTNLTIAEKLQYAARLLEYLEGESRSVHLLQEMTVVIEDLNFPLSIFSDRKELEKIRDIFFPNAHREIFSFFVDLVQFPEPPEKDSHSRSSHPTGPSSKPSPDSLPESGPSGNAAKTTPDFLARLEADVTPETIEVIELPYMGSQRAAILRDALRIRTVDELIRDCRRHLVQKINGFDATMEKRWIQGKWFSSDESGKFPPVSWPVAELIVEFLEEQIDLMTNFNIVGNFRSPWERFQKGISKPSHPSHSSPSPDRSRDYPPRPEFFPGPPVPGPANYPGPPAGPAGPIGPRPPYNPSGVRYRKSLREKIRSFFFRDEPNYVNPQFFDPLAAQRFNPPNPGGGPGPVGPGHPANPLPPGYAGPVDRPRDHFEKISEIPLVEELKPVGKYRRYEETVPSFDLLISTRNPAAVFDKIAELTFIQDVTDRKASEMTATISKDQLIYSENKKFPGSTIKVFTCYPESFATASVYYSSSKRHWKELSKRAEEKGMVLDRNGLFYEKKPIHLKKEADLYRKLDLPFLPPEIRNGIFEFTLTGNAPELLIRHEEMRGDLHLHSTFTDGTGSIEEMAKKGMSNGLDYIAMTDHSKRVYVAGGMDESKVLRYWKKIDQINFQLAGENSRFRILKGVELDVLADATLDFDDDIISQADWVMASLHFDQEQPREKIHKRLEVALRNPYVSAISHPTGKTYQSNFRIDMDIDFLFEMAKKYGKCVELNSQPRRFDLDWRLCRRAKEHGVMVVISTDSHAPDEMDYLRYGVQLARKAGLTRDDILNTRPVSEILALRKNLPLPEIRLKNPPHPEKDSL